VNHRSFCRGKNPCNFGWSWANFTELFPNSSAGKNKATAAYFTPRSRFLLLKGKAGCFLAWDKRGNGGKKLYFEGNHKFFPTVA
jgi:hypothetical protein